MGMTEYLTTSSGRKLFLQRMGGSQGVKQLQFYRDRATEYFRDLPVVYTHGLHNLIKEDKEPLRTLVVFQEANKSFPEFSLDDNKVEDVKRKLMDPGVLSQRVGNLLASDFIRDTGFIFLALTDGFLKHTGMTVSEEKKRNLLYGHVIAIDLSEGMDRVVDQDEDLEFLDDYRLMNPYILELAKRMISGVSQPVYQAFETGYRRALKAQSLDRKLKKTPRAITSDRMERVYDKYRAIMGTAARNMAFNIGEIAETYDLGMSRAAEAGGCTDEMIDSLDMKSLEIPSWPLYYTIQTNDPKKALRLTLSKGRNYLDQAHLALEMLPSGFSLSPFISALFLVLDHKMDVAYNEAVKGMPFEEILRQLSSL